MRWEIKKRFETEDGFHFWFAWYPVKVDDTTWVWFEWVGRKFSHYNVALFVQRRYKYRKKELMEY